MTFPAALFNSVITPIILFVTAATEKSSASFIAAQDKCLCAFIEYWRSFRIADLYAFKCLSFFCFAYSMLPNTPNFIELLLSYQYLPHNFSRTYVCPLGSTYPIGSLLQ